MNTELQHALHRPLLKHLAWLVFRDVNRTIGGGLPAIELMRRSATREQWIDERGHAVLTVVSRLTPGTNVIAYAVGLGWSVTGWLGAIVALLAASVPASLIVAALAATFVRVDQYPLVRLLIAVGVLVAAVLVASSAWRLMHPYITRAAAPRAALITAIVVVLLLIGATPVRILLVAAAVGALLGPAASPPVRALDR